MDANEALKDKWFIVDNKGGLFPCDDEKEAHEGAEQYDTIARKDAPHYAVQLQVAGTLPEGAVMSKYKVGDPVNLLIGGGTRVIKAIESSYRLSGELGSFLDSHISPVDPIRNDFDLHWFAGNWKNMGIRKDDAYTIWRAAKE